MPYTRTTYNTGDLITAAKLNGPEAYLNRVGNSRVRAYRSGSTQSLTSGVATEVVFNSEDYDTLGEFATGTGRFTAAAAGTYLVAAGVALGYGVTASAETVLMLYKNGALHSYLCDISTTGVPQLNGAALIELAATDYISIYVTAPGTSPFVTNSQTRTFFTVSCIQ